MRKILLGVFILFSAYSNAQIVNDWYDSTSFHGGVSVGSNLRIPSGAVNGYVLTTNGAGLATWQASQGGGGSTIDTSNFWNINGNSGTTAGANFVGTSDSTDLIIKSNANEMIRLSADGNYSFPFDPTQKAVTFGNVNSFFKFGEYYGLKLIAANNVDIASFQGLDADSIFTDIHSNGSFFGNTPEQAQIIYKKNNWQFGGKDLRITVKFVEYFGLC